METRANFALIGAFTLGVVFAAFLFVYWFSGGGRGQKPETYQIEFQGSVAGLLPGGAVQFNGLKVGEVTHLAISEQDPSRVDVLVAIDKRTPVKTNTRARIEQVGFTNVAVVSLIGGTPGSPPLTAREGETYPRIQAERSEIQNLLETVKTLSTHAGELLDKLNKLVDENSSAVTATLKNAATFSKALADHSGDAGDLIKSAAEVARSLKPAAARLDKVLAAGEKALNALDPKQIKQIAGNINHFSATGLRQYELLAVDARKAVNTIDRTVRMLEKDPSQVIWGPNEPAATETPAK